MLQRDGTGRERESVCEGEREGTQVVSEQLHRVVFYLSSRASGADRRICVCMCVRVSQVLAWPLPQVLCWDILHILYNDRDGPG